MNLSCVPLAFCLLAIGLQHASAQAPATAKPATNVASETRDWPQFLGPNRNGVSTETNLFERLPQAGPKIIWRAKGGIGKSGLAIAGGRLATMVQKEGQQWLIAMNPSTGAPAWQTALAPEYINQMGNGPRGTPAIAGDMVFAFTGEGILTACNLSDGKLLWSHNVVEEFRGKPAEYGMACSPLVVGDQVIVIAGAPQATVVAYDAKSGKVAWTAGDDAAGYSSPVLLEVGGREQLVAFTGGSVLGLTPATGSVLWRHEYTTDFGCNIATPLAHKGQVFISAGENHGSMLLALRPQADKFSVEEVWASLGPKSVLRSEWQTPILIGDHLYGMDNVGGAGPITHLTCIVAATGEQVWQQARFGKGNLIAADGKLFISMMSGELVVVRATPQAYEELGRAPILGSTRTAPSLAGGLLYLRDDQEIVCLDVRR